jgi:hypothetical protein
MLTDEGHAALPAWQEALAGADRLLAPATLRRSGTPCGDCLDAETRNLQRAIRPPGSVAVFGQDRLV